MKEHLNQNRQGALPKKKSSRPSGREGLQETERLKAFRKRKEKELKRRRRNKRIKICLFFILILASVIFGISSFCKHFGGSDKKREEPEKNLTSDVSLEETTEKVITEDPATEIHTTEEPTTEEPTTEAPDPREDVWEHYSNLFIVAGINNYLNVRDQPTADGSIIGKLVKYAGGELLEDMGNGWYHILSGGIEGYASSEYCKTGEEARQLALEHCFEMVEVTAERLNVRSGPGEEYEVWTQLSATEKQVVEAEENGWLKIAINSTCGYISKEYTRKGYYLVEAMPWSSISNYSATRQALFAYAEQFLGTPYVYGGTDLTGGIDCSSYVQQCFKNAIGISLPRTSREQVNCGTPVTLADAKPGDLLFYADAGGTIDHVAIYMGDGKILHAAQSLGQVIVSKYNYSTEPVAVRNIIGD